MNVGELIQKRRKELGLSQREVAKAVGVAAPTVCRWETGEINNMSRAKIAALAAVLKMSPLTLLEMDRPKNNVIPILGRIACGAPILAEENIEEYISLPTGIRADYALSCRGESMVGAGIQDGDTVYIQQTTDVQNGQIVAVRIKDEATLKRFRRTEAGDILMPENPKYEPIILTEQCGEDVQILGRAVAYLHRLP